MRTHLGGGVAGEHEKLGDHEIKRAGAVNFDIHFSWVVLACLFEDIEGGLFCQLM